MAYQLIPYTSTKIFKQILHQNPKIIFESNKKKNRIYLWHKLEAQYT